MEIRNYGITLKKNFTANGYRITVSIEPSFITHIFSIQNTYTTKHTGLDLSGVIKHIDAPDWASRSKNSHDDMFKLN